MYIYIYIEEGSKMNAWELVDGSKAYEVVMWGKRGGQVGNEIEMEGELNEWGPN